MSPAKCKTPKKSKTLAEVFAAEDAAEPAAQDVRSLADLVPAQKNPRKHNPQNIGMISDSLRAVGAGRSIVIDETNEIIAGNGLCEAAAEAGITKVQVVEADGNTIIAVRRRGLTPEQKMAMAVYDNRTGELAEWDVDVLRDFTEVGLDLQPFEFGGEVIAGVRQELPPPPVIRATRDTVAVADLTPHPRNYRSHAEAQIEHICHSIQEFGIYRSVVVGRGNVILTGHGVVTAANRLGIKWLPVVRLDLEPESPQALKILVGDNEVSFRADIDDRQLSEMLKEVKDSSDDGLLGTGYDAQQLAALAFVTRPADEIEDIDAAKHWVGLPEHDAGQREDLYEVLIRCQTEQDRTDLMRVLQAGSNHMRVIGFKTAMWWPLRERQKHGQFVNAAQVQDIAPAVAES